MQILSRKALTDLVNKEPGKHRAVIIHESGGGYTDVAHIVAAAKDPIVLEMDDVISGRVGGPTLELVKKALDIHQSSGFSYDIVACRQGVSRSSALAFLMECQKVGPQEAIRLLDVEKHYPNELIMKFGLELIGPEIKPVVTEFYKALAAHKGWSWQPHNLVTKYFKES